MNYTTIYIIASHWNGSLARLNNREYPTMLDAIHAIGSDIVDDGWSDVWVDGEGREQSCIATGVYRSEEDREANEDGSAPHRAIAVIREVRVPA